MKYTLNRTLLAAVLLLFQQILFSQTEPVEPPPDVVEESTPPGLSPPTAKDQIEQYRNGRYYGYRINDSVVIEAQYKYLEKPYSNFMIARKGKLAGVINGKGETLVPFLYTTFDKFEFEPLRKKTEPDTAYRWLRVCQAGQYGLLDHAGREVIAPEWDQMSWTHGDTLMLFGSPGRQRLIGPSGQTLLETQYDSWAENNPFPAFRRPLLAMVQNGKTGLIDFQNRVVLPFIYEKIDWVEGNFACVQNDQERKGIVNLQGKEVLPFEYIRVLQVDEQERAAYTAKLKLPKGRTLLAKVWDAENRFFFADDAGARYTFQ